MRNPYLPTKSRKLVTAGGGPITDLKGRHGSKLVADNGELNAHSKAELMKQIGELIDAYQTGKVVREPEPAEVIAERREIIKAALNDKTGEQWAVLGEVIGDEVWTALKREGFARKLLLYKPLGKGEIGRLRVRKKDVVGYMATTAAGNPQSVIRQSYVYPPEFYITASPVVEIKEIDSNPGDILSEKYEDALEAIMVQEDKVFLSLADAAALTSNDLFYFNSFTPASFSQMRTQIARWGIPVSNCIISYDIWDDIIADANFVAWFDEVSKHTLITEGYLGDILGIPIITDAFRDPNLKVLEEGQVYMAGSPQTLGGITQRTELTSEPINKFHAAEPVRGWFMYQIEGMAIVNSRAICKGQRI